MFMNPTKITLLPSYPAPGEEELFAALDNLAGVSPEFQIDMVDGKFVDAISWPFTEGDFSTAIDTLPESVSQFVLEFDCMVMEPIQYLDDLYRVGAGRVIVHHGSTQDYESCVAHAREHGYQIGLAILPTVELSEVKELIEDFDYVQVMGIAEVGKQGQPFAEESLTLIAAIRELFPEKEIAVDGSVNADTIPALIKAGANRLAPGSAIIAAPNQAAAYQELVGLILLQQSDLA